MISILYVLFLIIVIGLLLYIYLEKIEKDGLDKIYIGLIIFFIIISIFFALTDPDNGTTNWPHHRHEGFMVTALIMCFVYFPREKK